MVCNDFLYISSQPDSIRQSENKMKYLLDEWGRQSFQGSDKPVFSSACLTLEKKMLFCLCFPIISLTIKMLTVLIPRKAL